MPRSGVASQVTSRNLGLPIALWIVQFITISVYIYIVTFLVARMAAKGDLGVLGPSYLTILILFFLIIVLLSNEVVFLLGQTLTPELYLNSQIVKISLFIMTLLSIEVFGLAWRKQDINQVNATLTGIVGGTLLASIPFSLSLVLAWTLRRSHGSGVSIVVTAVDEEAVDEEAGERRPLLGDHAYTA